MLYFPKNFRKRHLLLPIKNYINSLLITHRNNFGGMTMVISLRNTIFAPTSSRRTKIMLLGSGELGKEIIIEAQRLGFYAVAVDRYDDAPGFGVAHKSYAGNMKDAGFLRSIVEKEKPDAIVPEIEAINLDLLFDLEKEGYNVIPNAAATHAAMHRERIREIIAKKAGVETSKYEYVTTLDEMREACEKLGYPCWSKAIMDSSGHASSFIKSEKDTEAAFKKATTQARGSGEKLIIEEHIPFDLEITELAVRHYDENGNIVTSFPKPVGHYQTRGGDYHASWQCAEVSDRVEHKIYETAGKIVDALGGLGLFGCEMFVKGDKVYGNECSPRPHDTGMVTYVTHQTGFSEAGLHVRAITGLPIPTSKENGFSIVPQLINGASHVVLSPFAGADPGVGNLVKALSVPGVTLLHFGKPEAYLNRRMGVVLATDTNVQKAKLKAQRVAHMIEMSVAQLAYTPWTGQTSMEKHLPEEERPDMSLLTPEKLDYRAEPKARRV